MAGITVANTCQQKGGESNVLAFTLLMIGTYSGECQALTCQFSYPFHDWRGRYVAQQLSVSHSVTSTTGKPCATAYSPINRAMFSAVGLTSSTHTGSPWSRRNGSTGSSRWRSIL